MRSIDCLKEGAKINKANNVLEFKKGSDFFYKLSQRALDKGDYAGAVSYLKNAVAANANDYEYNLELAKTLSLAAQYEQSNLIYLKLLALGRTDGKLYIELSQNLYYLNDMEHSIYYLNLYMDKYSDIYEDEESDEYIEIVEDISDYDGYGLVYPLEKQDMTETIDNARGLMKAGVFEKAAQLLKKVPKGNVDYLFARNNLALCCFFLNDYSSTKKYSDEILSEDKDNIFALCNLAAMYNYINDGKNSSVYTNRFLKIETEDISDLFKIATTLCELKEHGLALDYLKRILFKKPFDTNIMFLTALAYYNNKMVAKAQDMFLKLIKLNDKDYAAKYYLKLINSVQGAKDIENGFFQPLEYICQVPYGEMLDRIKKFKTLLASRGEFKKAVEENPETTELCDWCLGISDIKFQKIIVSRLADLKSAKAAGFLREKLIDPKTAPDIKKVITEKFILNRAKTPYHISVDYIVKNLTPAVFAPEKQCRAYYQAYAASYSVMSAYLADNIENDLLGAYKHMTKAALKKGIEGVGKKTLAAIMAYKSKKVKSVKIKKSICKIFNVSVAEFEKYAKDFD